MKNKLKTLIAKFLGVDEMIKQSLEALSEKHAKDLEAIAEETNNRINECEDKASEIEDLTDKVENIESAEYVSSDYVDDQVQSAISDLSDELDDKVAEAVEEATNEFKEQLSEILEKTLTKELLLRILNK